MIQDLVRLAFYTLVACAVALAGWAFIFIAWAGFGS